MFSEATGDKVETEAKKMPAAFAKFFKSGSQAPCATGESSEKRKPGKPENVSEKKSKSDGENFTFCVKCSLQFGQQSP